MKKLAENNFVIFVGVIIFILLAIGSADTGTDESTLDGKTHEEVTSPETSAETEEYYDSESDEYDSESDESDTETENSMVYEIDEMVETEFGDVPFDEKGLGKFQTRIGEIASKYNKTGDEAFMEYMDWKSKK